MTEPQKLPVEAARKQFAELLNGSQFRGEHTEITRHGNAAGYLVPPDWYERAQKALATPGAIQSDNEISALIAAHRDVVGRLSDRDAAELASRAFSSANPQQFKALSDATAKGNHAVVEAALECGALTESQVRAV